MAINIHGLLYVGVSNMKFYLVELALQCDNSLLQEFLLPHHLFKE